MAEGVLEQSAPGGQIVSRARATQWTLRDSRNWRLQKLEVLFDNAKLSDIKIRPNIIIPKESEEDDGREFYYAQKAYLAAWSPVFDSIFFGQGVGTAGVGAVEDGELTLECLKDILWLFLKFLYTGEIVLTIDTVWPFYCFVNTYQVNDLIDSVEDIMDKAVSVDTCCSLLCSAQQLGSYDHYALRKCLNMLLMDFPEVSETPGFLGLDYDVLAAVVSSDELNAAEECVFEACMNWIAADEQRLELYLDDLLGHVRFPLMHTKYVAKLDSHPVAARSKVITELMLQALKFAVAPKEMSQFVNPATYKARKGGLYWKATKNNMALDISSPNYKTFVLNSSCDLVQAWKMRIELFEEGSCVVGVCEDTIDTSYYCGRFKDGWGLADNGHFYCGQCKCDPTVKHLCTPACQAHMEIHHGAVISIAYLKETQDLVFRQGNKIFRQRLKNVNPEKRLFPAISLRAAKCRIFKEEGDVLEGI
ncbi:unnamed protein product [Amoebophrya sp. A25]|nr:unnamed protein product [Amoebophrya sp. A25]|eukprot:GSA25T00007669001.1